MAKNANHGLFPGSAVPTEPNSWALNTNVYDGEDDIFVLVFG